jgi:hypothetical protein
MMNNNNDINNLRKTLENIERDLRLAKKLLFSIEEVNKKNYREVPGVEGMFDGSYLITSEGEKHEVPENYSAKSRLVYGDTLKMVDEEGKKLFKQIARVERKIVQGIINKKEGKWYVLADTGSYRLNDKAVEFNGLSLNDKVEVSIPQDNLNAPYAALENVLEAQNPKKPVKDDVGGGDDRKPKNIEPGAKGNIDLTAGKTVAPKKPVRKKPSTQPAQIVKPVQTTPVKPPEKKKEFVEQIGEEGETVEKKPDVVTRILGDDDLR